MATVGEQLRQAREARGLSVAQVAETTRIRSDHVRALEEGNYDVFVATVYVRGSARSYAAAVGLDAPKLLAALDAELARTERFREPPSLGEEPPGLLTLVSAWLARRNWKVAGPILALAAVAVAGLVAVRTWQNHVERHPLNGVDQGVYQPPQPQAGEVLPLPPPPPRK